MNGHDQGIPGASARSGVVVIAWLLIAGLCLFTAENLWIDPWLRSKSRRIPSFIPEAFSGLWLLIVLAMLMAVVLVITCLILVRRSAKISAARRGLLAAGAFVATLLSAMWVMSTSGLPLPAKLFRFQNPHAVTLRWNASTTPGAKYNIYRRSPPGMYERLNAAPQDERTYTDNDVAGGATYVYVTRAVIAGQPESGSSNEVTVTIP